jgi:hypothetical protein
MMPPSGGPTRRERFGEEVTEPVAQSGGQMDAPRGVRLLVGAGRLTATQRRGNGGTPHGESISGGTDLAWIRGGGFSPLSALLATDISHDREGGTGRAGLV